jgi:3-hydroxyacyl-[acyl-carrier protein] dehydratase / trans-2-decenoyl-[acyl-carrier protein] isomerase
MKKIFEHKGSYGYNELLAFAKGEFDGDLPKLPLPPMLMLDRVTFISETGGRFDKGTAVAEMDIRPDLWFFPCHFKDDSVMPGCLMLDGFWQLTGFYMGWCGAQGKGRATGALLELKAEILPTAKVVQYTTHVEKLLLKPKMSIVKAQGTVSVDGVLAATITQASVVCRR